MTNVLIFIVVAIAIALVVSLLRERLKTNHRSSKYLYQKKDFFLSRAEHEFYDALASAVDKDYLIFAQVHLPTLVVSEGIGKERFSAFRHINGKSVDFVLCDKAYISPKLIIELDDRTHERPGRVERDVEVERILREAGLPLLRIRNHGGSNSDELRIQIKNKVSGKTDD